MPSFAHHLVFLDTETTGLDPAVDRVIDVGAVRVDAQLNVVDRFTTLVDPRVPIPLYVMRLTGIADDDVRGAPSFAAAYEDLCRFAADAIIAGHNVAFDLEHLAAGARRAGLAPLHALSFDTLEAALVLYPELDRHALAVLSQHFGIGNISHRALPDAQTTLEVFRRLCQRAASLAPPERRLLEAVGWPPLQLLDGYAQAPQEAPPPLVAAEPLGADFSPSGTLTTLPCDVGGWRPQFDGPPAAGADPATEAAPGLAGRLHGFRTRPGQIELAADAAALLERGGIGLLEAGTGMGKSLAYLLPAAFYSAATGRRVLVSTKTKALQRQLATHDLPLVEAALPPGWRWALLMGRENYLCRRQLEEALGDATRRLPQPSDALALAYLMGRARYGEVDLSALPYRATRELPALRELARELRSSRSTCLGRHCPVRMVCHWRLARARADAAHLVCVNHALLFSGAESLPGHDTVVVDEAHHLAAEATAAFSDEIDWLTVENLLGDVRGHRRQRPLPVRLRAAARSAEAATAKALAASADDLERVSADLPLLSRGLGSALSALARAASDDEPDSDYALSVWITPGLREQSAWEAFVEAGALLAEAMAALASAAARAAEALPDDHRDGVAARALADEAPPLAELLGDLTDLDDPDVVVSATIDDRTADRRERAARHGGERWSITRTPLVPASRIRAALWDKLRCAILTSATLAVGSSFEYFREMTGLARDLDVQERIYPSPFDFARQAVLVLERATPGAYVRDEQPRRQAERLKRLSELTGGRTLALFTNKREMEQVAGVVGAHLEADGVLVLAQGLHGSAAALADEFRSHPATVLLGVDTLWTGQDFPGDTLVCLVIAKLPFPRLDPLMRAREQRAREQGFNWFTQLYLPEAVLKFRQGFGRLIRTESDKGVVVVLDPRVTSMDYGRQFLASLPRMPHVLAAPEEVASAVAASLTRLGVSGVAKG